MIPLAPVHHNKQLQVSLEWTELFPLFFLAQVIQAANGYKSWQVRLPFLFLGTKLLALSEFSNLPISWNHSLSQCHVCSIILRLPPWNRPTSDRLKNSHLNQIWRHIRFFDTKNNPDNQPRLDLASAPATVTPIESRRISTAQKSLWSEMGMGRLQNDLTQIKERLQSWP